MVAVSDEEAGTVVLAFAAYSAIVVDNFAVVADFVDSDDVAVKAVVSAAVVEPDSAVDGLLVAREDCFFGIYFHLHEEPSSPQLLPVAWQCLQ